MNLGVAAKRKFGVNIRSPLRPSPYCTRSAEISQLPKWWFFLPRELVELESAPRKSDPVTPVSQALAYNSDMQPKRLWFKETGQKKPCSAKAKLDINVC